MRRAQVIAMLVCLMLPPATAAAQTGVDAAAATADSAGMISGTTQTEGVLRFSLGFDFALGGGMTEYIYDQTISGQSGDVRVKSQLEFPLDALIAGGRFGLSSTGGRRPWDLELALYQSFTDPNDPMKDTDWIYIPGGFNGKFSYTESSVDMKMTHLISDWRWWLRNSERFQLGPLLGFRYQRIAQDIVGYEGWQIDFQNPPYDQQSIRGTELAIQYRISYYMPEIGAASRFEIVTNLYGTLEGALMPVYFDDFDDHVLRKKTAVASGWGLGYELTAGAHVPLSGGPGRGPILGVEFEWLQLSADGNQTQTWYGDDPGTPGDDTGTEFTGLPHEVNSSQWRVVFSTRYVF